MQPRSIRVLSFHPAISISISCFKTRPGRNVNYISFENNIRMQAACSARLYSSSSSPAFKHALLAYLNPKMRVNIF